MKENSFKKSIFKSEQDTFQDDLKYKGQHYQAAKTQGYDDDNESSVSSAVCKNCQKFEVLMRKMIKENEQLIYEIKYKEIAMQKREELMTHYATESQQSKHQILNLKNKIAKLEAQIEQQQPDYTARSFFSKNSQNILRAASMNSAQLQEQEENRENNRKQNELANQMQESITKLERNKNMNQEGQVEEDRRHKEQYPVKYKNDIEKVNHQNMEEGNQPLNKVSLMQASNKNLYKIDMPNSKSKTLVDLSKGYPKVIKSSSAMKTMTHNNAGTDNSGFFNKEQDLMFNYDKYDHYVLKNQSNTERKIQNPPIPSSSQQQQNSTYKNPYIKIKKKQRSAQSVSDISQLQHGTSSYTPTKFVERDQIQRDQDVKILMNKMSHSKLDQSQIEQEQVKDNQQNSAQHSRPASSNNQTSGQLNIPYNNQPMNVNESRPISVQTKSADENHLRPSSSLSYRQNNDRVSNRPDSEHFDKISEINQIDVSQQRPNTSTNHLSVENTENYKQNTAQSQNKAPTPIHNRQSENGQNNGERKNEQINIVVNNLPIQNFERDNTPEKMEGSQNLMTSKYRPSRELQNGEVSIKNHTLTPPTNRSSVQGRNQVNPQMLISRQGMQRKSFYGTLETFQSDDHLEKHDKQDSPIEENQEEDEEKKKGMNFTQAVSRQSPSNSPHVNQGKRLNSSGSNRNLKQSTTFMMSSSQNQNLSTPNRMFNSQRSPQRISKKYQYRKLDDVENQLMFLTNQEDLKRAKKNPRNYWIGDFVEDPNQFFYKLNLQPQDQQVSFAESIQKLLTDYVISLDYGLMLKKSLESCTEVSKSLRFNEILKNLHEQLIRNINCQKIFFYIYDEKTKELWSTKSDNSVIRIKPQRGLLKHIVTTLEKIKVDDIAFDPRFEPEIDSILHPDIKSLLLIPLLNYQSGLMGVVQFVNLNYKSKAKYVYDQMKVENIIRVSGNIISIGMIYEQNYLNNQRIMKLLTSNIRLFEIDDITELMADVQEVLVEIFGTQKCAAYIINENNMLERYTKVYLEDNYYVLSTRQSEHKSNEITNKKKYTISSQVFELRTGIIGLSISSHQEQEILDPQVHPFFNPLTDLDTYLPTYTLPIISNDKVLGAIQVAYLNTQLGKKVLKMETLYKEIIQHIGSVIGHCIQKIQKYDLDISNKIQAEKKVFTQEIEQLKVKLKQRSNSTKSVVSPVLMSRSNRGPIYNSQSQLKLQSSQSTNRSFAIENEQYKKQRQMSNSSNLIAQMPQNSSQQQLPKSSEKIESYADYQEQKSKLQLLLQNKEFNQSGNKQGSYNYTINKQSSQHSQNSNNKDYNIPLKQYPTFSQDTNLNKQQNLHESQKSDKNKIQNRNQQSNQTLSNEYIKERSQHSKLNPQSQNDGVKQWQNEEKQ